MEHAVILENDSLRQCQLTAAFAPWFKHFIASSELPLVDGWL